VLEREVLQHGTESEARVAGELATLSLRAQLIGRSIARIVDLLVGTLIAAGAAAHLTTQDLRKLSELV